MFRLPLTVKLLVIAAALAAIAGFRSYAACTTHEHWDQQCVQAEDADGNPTEDEVCVPSDMIPPPDDCTFAQSCITLPDASDGSTRCATSGCNPCDVGGGGGGGIGGLCVCGADPFTDQCLDPSDPLSSCYIANSN